LLKIEKIQNQNTNVTLSKPDDTRLKQLEAELIEFEKEYDKLINKQEQIDRVKSRILDKSVKRELYEFYIPIFVQKVNEILSKIFEDDILNLSIDLDPDFNIIGLKRGKKFNLYTLSEGQLGVLNLSFLLAFHYILGLKSGNGLNFLQVDEILDGSGLSTSRKNSVLEFFKEMSKDKLILLISHDQNLDVELFDKIIEVDVEDGFSKYTIV
jgi:DNA repair exonuclease SbcCD ATPase subunit